MVRFVDLSHPIEDGMAAYPGLPSPRVGQHRTHAASRDHYGGQAEFAISRLELVGNVGTYVDSPFHRYPGAPDVSGVPLERLVGLAGVVLDIGDAPGRAVDVAAPPGVLRDRAVLFRSSWDRRWRTPSYWEPGPYLSERAVNTLVEAGPALVGVDFWNVDDPDDPRRPVHTALLEREIPIVEHLCDLDRLPTDGFRFFAVPVAVVGAASMPVRAFAEL